MDNPCIFTVRNYLLSLQEKIVRRCEKIEGSSFYKEPWKSEKCKSEGLSYLIENGKLFERACILFSHIKRNNLPESAHFSMHPVSSKNPWQAIGVSVVFHPRNPHVPSVHMNVRMFLSETADINQENRFWFGGGMDLTPFYVYEEDIFHFHKACHGALSPYGPNYYQDYKQWCDNYFFLKHRNETRGVGGIFFDGLNSLGFDKSFALIRSVGDAFLNSYFPILERREAIPYGEHERTFQAHRRARYVEFNLIFDRGTLFGLQSEGRIESIFLSMPPIAKWSYNWKPKIGSKEEKLYKYLKPMVWIL